MQIITILKITIIINKSLPCFMVHIHTHIIIHINNIFSVDMYLTPCTVSLPVFLATF